MTAGVDRERFALLRDKLLSAREELKSIGLGHLAEVIADVAIAASWELSQHFGAAPSPRPVVRDVQSRRTNDTITAASASPQKPETP